MWIVNIGQKSEVKNWNKSGNTTETLIYTYNYMSSQMFLIKCFYQSEHRIRIAIQALLQ